MRGEASSLSLAQQVVRRYDLLDDDDKTGFFELLLAEFSPDEAAVKSAIAGYESAPGPDTVQQLAFVTEAPRLALLRAVNIAEGGTATVLQMRADCLDAARTTPHLAPVERDLGHLMASWFNRGFLSLQRIDWQTPAAVLEKLIEYEAVHEIRGWEDLQRRLADDRRCFGFFHPSLPGEPLIFVEVALTVGLQGSIHAVLDAPVPDDPANAVYDTAIFYSITNCQVGLRGVPLGNFLLKRVTDELHASVPSVRTFSTLSPIPGYVDWVAAGGGGLDAPVAAAVSGGGPIEHAHRDPVMRSCAHYLLHAKRGAQPLDPVARFHLRNGARLERINWAGDTSPKGIGESYGMLVNYMYEPESLTGNHEAYMNDYAVAHSAAVTRLVS